MLDTQQIDKVKATMRTVGWQEVMLPAMQEHGKQLIKLLLKAPSERPEPYRSIPDDVIRGEVRGIQWLIEIWTMEIGVFEHNQRRDQEDEAQANGSTADSISANQR